MRKNPIHNPFIAVFCLLFALTGCREKGVDRSYWQSYKAHFITAEGRVVDTENNGISHSEGQGYGMLLAVESDDKKTFRQLWQWTRTNLQVRQDYLFAWKYVPDRGVPDNNNASDGDILIAWALQLAGDRWDDETYHRQSRKILVDIRNKLVRIWEDKTILLPGVYGFAREGRFTVNLSYWVFPAFADFKRLDPSPVWDALSEDGLKLQAAARYGRWQLPPDWLELHDGMRISPQRRPLFSYDAIRIPLYMLWNKMMSVQAAEGYLSYARRAKEEKGYLPAWVNLLNNDLADYDAPRGIKAVYRLQQAFIDRAPYQMQGPLRSDDDYYSSTLSLLTLIAAKKIRVTP
jgi:endo-1,4-beta-D-glucanase Y